MAAVSSSYRQPCVPSEQIQFVYYEYENYASTISNGWRETSRAGNEYHMHNMRGVVFTAKNIQQFKQYKYMIIINSIIIMCIKRISVGRERERETAAGADPNGRTD